MFGVLLKSNIYLVKEKKEFKCNFTAALCIKPLGYKLFFLSLPFLSRLYTKVYTVRWFTSSCNCEPLCIGNNIRMLEHKDFLLCLIKPLFHGSFFTFNLSNDSSRQNGGLDWPPVSEVKQARKRASKPFQRPRFGPRAPEKPCWNITSNSVINSFKKYLWLTGRGIGQFSKTCFIRYKQKHNWQIRVPPCASTYCFPLSTVRSSIGDIFIYFWKSNQRLTFFCLWQLWYILL